MEPILAQIPQKRNVICDLIHNEKLTFDPESKVVQKEPFVHEKREDFLEKISEFDDGLAESIINDHQIQVEEVKMALKRIVQDSKAILTFCGSAYKNVGVQPLLDAIIDFLPDPSINVIKGRENELCALAFKIVHHPTKGTLTFVRIYSGQLREGDSLFNMTRGINEKVSRIAIAYANDFVQVKEADLGSIAVISGLKETVTGDTLVTSSAFVKKNPDFAALAGVSIPDPVFFASIEPPSMSKQKDLDKALANLSREDPSLRVEFNRDQTILKGMGQLHLDILLQRIRKEYKIDADLGPLMVAYKEVPTLKTPQLPSQFERHIGGDRHQVGLELSLQPLKNPNQKSTLTLMKTVENLKPFQVKALHKGFESAMLSGPILSYPVLGGHFQIHGAEIKRNTSEAIISAAFVQAAKQILKEAQAKLAEPVMSLIIHAEPEVVGPVIQDLLQKRGQVLERENSKSLMVITAQVPLSELKTYSTELRILTSGKASFGMEFSHYQVMDQLQQNEAIKQVTGFDPK